MKKLVRANSIKSVVSKMCSLRWSERKPKLSKECLLIIATLIDRKWDYALFQIIKIDFEDKWYWGICTTDGDEWGNYSDLKADKYCEMKLLGVNKKHFQ